MNVRYTPEAVNDLHKLREYIEEKNPAAARRISLELVAGIGKLKVFPKMGLPVGRAPDPDMIRDLYVGNYTVRYMVSGIDIFVLRIWHAKEIEQDL